LAIQISPENPPAAFLWRPVPDILNSTVSFKVGGNFVYPPPTLDRSACEKIDRVVFVAGGVGINPIISMISALNEVGTSQSLGGMTKTVRVLYSSRRETESNGQGAEILFETRLRDIAGKWDQHEHVDYKYSFFETSGQTGDEHERPMSSNMAIHSRRISQDDLLETLGPEDDRGNAVVYVCGLPTMTDEFVELLKHAPGMDEKRVLCEKWW
jgi:ferredoxin-NADP reductase